jgi:hypothetical protein
LSLFVNQEKEEQEKNSDKEIKINDRSGKKKIVEQDSGFS